MMQPENQMAKIAAQLRRLRLERGLGLRALAARADLHPSVLSRLENAERRSVKPETLRRLANALEVDVEELYATAYLPTVKALPELQTYLRAKYNLPAHAAKQVDEYVEALRDRWQHESTKEEQQNGAANP